MNRIVLADLSLQQLVQRFTAIALEQSEALRTDRLQKYNKLYDRMEDVRRELKSRNGDRRDALSELMRHPNAQVRLKAAITVLAISRGGEADTSRYRRQEGVSRGRIRGHDVEFN